jgi:hypothetical protein
LPIWRYLEIKFTHRVTGVQIPPSPPKIHRQDPLPKAAIARTVRLPRALFIGGAGAAA